MVQVGLIPPLALGLANQLILSLKSQGFVQEWAWTPIQSNESHAHPELFLEDYEGELFFLFGLLEERTVFYPKSGGGRSYYTGFESEVNTKKSKAERWRDFQL